MVALLYVIRHLIPFSGTYCDPLEDKNVHGFLEPLSSEVSDGEIIMAVTKVRNLSINQSINSNRLKNFKLMKSYRNELKIQKAEEF